MIAAYVGISIRIGVGIGIGVEMKSGALPTRIAGACAACADTNPDTDPVAAAMAAALVLCGEP